MEVNLLSGYMMRPSIDEYFITMAKLAASRGTCIRRKVGCILVSKENQVLATGYNGVPSGFDHCIDIPCEGAHYESGQGLDKCESIHAEMNAVINCKDVREIYTAYCTTAPCVHCIKVLLNTGCKRLVMAEPYPHSEVSQRLWEQGGRIWDTIKVVKNQ